MRTDHLRRENRPSEVGKDHRTCSPVWMIHVVDHLLEHALQRAIAAELRAVLDAPPEEVLVHEREADGTEERGEVRTPPLGVVAEPAHRREVDVLLAGAVQRREGQDLGRLGRRQAEVLRACQHARVTSVGTCSDIAHTQSHVTSAHM